jgi:RNA polymerase sigma-70 factor (ECF subfamily)
MARHLEMAESLSMAFPLIMETLSPVERAVFLLREVFDYGCDRAVACIRIVVNPENRAISALSRTSLAPRANF